MGMQLNPQQLQAIDHHEGPLLIIAGAGSGKTRVLTERLARIIEKGLARPEETLTVTFTNKAAAEIKERVMHRLREMGIQTSSIPWMGTFHSIAVKILRREAHHLGLNNNFTIYDPDDQLSIVKQAFETLNISVKNNNPKAILGGISNAKNELLGPKEYAQFATGYYQETTAEVYQVYQKLLHENQALDFDDLLMYTVKLFQEVPEVAARYRNQFKYVMVDEYQDTNHAQYVLVKLMAEEHQNICVVGDDDQSIYSWRGANIRNILEFEQDFQGVTVIKLEQNYRSTQKILLAGNSIASGISKRKSKKLWTENDEGDNITLYEALDEKDEGYWLAEKISDMVEEGVSPEEIAVLYRMNAQSRVLEEVLLKAGVSYRIVGNVRFYDRREIKDMLAYLRLVYNPADSVSLMRIINVPSRKIGAKTINDIKQKAAQSKMNNLEYLLSQQNLLAGGVRKFTDIAADIIAYSHDRNITDLIGYILTRSGYQEMLDDGTEENQQRLENIKELISVASKYKELSPQASLQAFLEEVALVEAQASEIGMEQERVTLMTVHSAKGLEFAQVFIVGMEEGLFPHSRAFASTEDLDEERRLAYVAVTRAKNRLYISYTASRTIFGSRQPSIQSRFLNDIDPSIVDFNSYGGAWRDADGDSWGSYGSGVSSKSIYGSSYGAGSSNVLRGRAALDKFKSHSESSGTQFHVKPGDRVQHPLFGRGKVISIDDSTVIVDFEGKGKKELDTEFANLVRA